MKLYSKLSRRIGCLKRCQAANNQIWADKWQADIESILEEFPSGSGFDSGTKLDDSSTPEKLVFTTAFHYMNDGGMYDGWTEHSVIVTPSMEHGYKLKVTGRNRNEIKDYIAECFHEVLHRDVEEYDSGTAQCAP